MQVPGKPRLSTWAFTADPVAKNLAAVGVALDLNLLPIEQSTLRASGIVHIGCDTFDAKIDAVKAGQASEIDTGAEACGFGQDC